MFWIGGQDTPDAGVSCPRGMKIHRVGGKIPRGIFTLGVSSPPGGKLPGGGGQDILLHRLILYTYSSEPVLRHSRNIRDRDLCPGHIRQQALDCLPSVEHYVSFFLFWLFSQQRENCSEHPIRTQYKQS